MSNSFKQIYVAIEICEKEIKLLVAEYFNTRFNVIRVDRSSTNAISDFKIIDRNSLKNDISSLINSCSEKLNTKIEQVILVLPTYNFKKYSLQFSTNTSNGTLTNNDIISIIKESYNTKVDSDVIIVNPVVKKYTVNGISSRRAPINEQCEQIAMDVDLLCADKDISYDYVSIVEECGIKVLDIVLNAYAIGKEASLFDESLKRNIMCFDIGKTCTYISLFSKGSLFNNEIIFEGISNMVSEIKKVYDIPEDDIVKMLKHSVNYHPDYPDDVIYAYGNNGSTKTITTKDINDIMLSYIDSFIEKLLSVCKPILDQNDLIFITGEAEQIDAFISRFKENPTYDVRAYCPETLGVRDSSLTSLFGSLFAYNDKAILNNQTVSCVDLLEYNSHIDKKDIDTEGETITTKIKNLFKQYVDKEEE